MSRGWSVTITRSTVKINLSLNGVSLGSRRWKCLTCATLLLKGLFKICLAGIAMVRSPYIGAQNQSGRHIWRSAWSWRSAVCMRLKGSWLTDDRPSYQNTIPAYWAERSSLHLRLYLQQVVATMRRYQDIPDMNYVSAHSSRKILLRLILIMVNDAG